MRLIGQRPVVGVDKGNHFSNEHVLEWRVGHGESASAWPSTSSGSAGRRQPPQADRRAQRRDRDPRRVLRQAPPASSAHAGNVTIANHHDEWPGFAFCNQVVQDQAGVPLTAPSVFIFPGAVLNVQHRIPFRSLFIIGRSIHVALQRGVGDLREEVHFPQVAVRHVFHRVEIGIVRGDFDAAAPTARSVKHERSRIGDTYAIHVELVIVEAFILRVGNAAPPAVGVLGHRVADSADIEQHALRSWRPQTGSHAPLRIDLGILPELPVDHRVQLRGFEVFHRCALIDFDGRRAPRPPRPA